MSTATVTDQLPPPDAAPAATRRFDQTWLINFLIRNSMVIVLLLVMAYFSYRSVRFATPENALTILVAAAPFALVALGHGIAFSGQRLVHLLLRHRLGCRRHQAAITCQVAAGVGDLRLGAAQLLHPAAQAAL